MIGGVPQPGGRMRNGRLGVRPQKPTLGVGNNGRGRQGRRPGMGGIGGGYQGQGPLDVQSQPQDAFQQNIGNFMNTQLGAVQNSLAQPFDYSGIAQAPGVNDFAGERQRVEDDLYSQHSKRLDPQFQQEKQAFAQELADRGIPTGGQEYDQRMNEFADRQANAYALARSQAIQAGGAEQQRLYGQAVDARNRAIAERVQQRQMPLGELGALGGLYGMGLQDQQAAAQLAGQLGMFQQGTAHDASMAGVKHKYDMQALQKELANRLQLAKMGGGGGGGSGYDPFALNDQKFMQQLALMQYQNQMNQGNRPSTGDQLLGLGGAVLGQGLGAWLGGDSGISSWF